MKSIMLALGLIITGGVQAQSYDTAFGQEAMVNLTNGNYNSAFGAYSLFELTTGNYNTGIGMEALYSNSIGNGNTAVGEVALVNNTAGGYNTANGYYSMVANNTGQYNSGFGSYTLRNNTFGNYNTAIGVYALSGNTTGSSNIGIGWNAGSVPKLGASNILIGHPGLANDTGVIRIGFQGTQRFTQIAGIYNTKLATGGQAVYVNSKGQLGIVNTKIVTSVAPATQADILALRQDLVATKNMVYALQRQLAAKSVK